jgi:cob(I)alamin adenosyltransferase
MNKKNEILSKEQERKLQKMVNDMLDVASDLAQEYKDLDMSELTAISSSITQVHEDSPFLNDIFEGESWKRVIKNIPTIPKKPKDKDAS